MRVPWTAKKTNEWVLENAHMQRQLLTRIGDSSLRLGLEPPFLRLETCLRLGSKDFRLEHTELLNGWVNVAGKLLQAASRISILNLFWGCRLTL
jgi:hypothetical protein